MALAARKHSIPVTVDRQNGSEGDDMNGVHTSQNSKTAVKVISMLTARHAQSIKKKAPGNVKVSFRYGRS